MNSMNYTRIIPLTSIRFFAAILVVIYHYGHSVWPFDSGLLHKLSLQAGSAVAFFFFLSGFILAHVYHRADWSEPGVLKRYFVSRFARIYPIYALALLVQFGIVLAGMYIDRITIVSKLVLLQLHAMLFQAWLPDSVMTLNAPGWSLSVEAGFYLLFPFIIRRIMRLRKSWVLPMAIGLFLGSQGLFLLMRTAIWGEWFYSNQMIHNALLYHPLIYYPVFVMGVLTFRLTQARAAMKPLPRPQWMAVLSILSMIGITALSVSGGERMWYGIHVGLLSPLYGLLIYSLCESRSLVAKALSFRWMNELGEASYGVYILQMPVHGLMAMWLPIQGSAQGFYLYAVTLVVISYLLYRGFETPMRRWIRARWSPPRLG